MSTPTSEEKKWLEQLRGYRMHRGRKSVFPRRSYTDRELKWEPKPFIANRMRDTGGSGEFYYDESALRPNGAILTVCQISKYVFDSHAEYLAGIDYDSGVWVNFQYISSACPIWLAAEDDSGEIYCVSFPMGIPVIFGKLLHRNVLYKLAAEAFAGLIN